MFEMSSIDVCGRMEEIALNSEPWRSFELNKLVYCFFCMKRRVKIAFHPYIQLHQKLAIKVPRHWMMELLRR